MTTAVPHLRIVDDDLWEQVKARQVEMRRMTSNCTPGWPTSIVRRSETSAFALESEESHTGAVEAIRALNEAIVLEPDGERLKIT